MKFVYYICLDKIYFLEDRNGEGSGFIGIGLSLGNVVMVSNDGYDSMLLDSRRLFKIVSVDIMEEFVF